MSSSDSDFKAALDAAISQILNNNFDADSKVCILTLLKVLDNVLQQPHNDKVRSIRTANPTFTKKVIEKKGHPVLLAVGFEVTKNNQQDDVLLLKPEKEDTQQIVQARHTLEKVAVHQLQCPPDTLPAFQPPKPKIEIQQCTNAAGFTSTSTSTGFNIYQARRFDGQSAAVGANLGAPEGWQSKTEQQLDQLQKQQAKLQEKLQKAAGGRDWTVLLPGQQSSNSVAAAAALAASNTPTSQEDSKMLAQHIQKQQASRQAAENRGFTTKAMRDLEALKKANVYSHTQLAVQFPNGVMVKANFLPQETVRVVMEGLREHVFAEEHASPLPSFELYVTPPRQLLETDKKLHELGLVPAAKVYVSWKQKLTTPTGGGLAWFVRPQLLHGNQKGPAMPTSMAVASKDKEEGDNNPPAAAADKNKRPKKSKADKEANLLARMMGK